MSYLFSCVAALSVLGLQLMAHEIPAAVYPALKQCFADDADSYERLSFFLANSAAKDEAHPFINALLEVIQLPEVFKKVAERMVSDIKAADKYPKYRQVMFDIWNQHMKEDAQIRSGHGQQWDFAVPQKNVCLMIQVGLLNYVANMPPKQYHTLVNEVTQFCERNVVGVVANALIQAEQGSQVVRIGLLGVSLSLDVITEIRRWWKGEITGVRCVKNIVDNGASISAGIAGGVGGEVMGAAVGAAVGGPLGAAIGGFCGRIAGGVSAAYFANVLSDKLTQWVFGLPKSEALENAYRFLGAPASASNSDVNSCYRRLAFQYHPDKGGDADKWTQLQYSMAIVREARDEK